MLRLQGGSDTSCYSRQSVDDMFRLHSRPLSGRTSHKSTVLASRSLKQKSRRNTIWSLWILDFWGQTTTVWFWRKFVKQTSAIHSAFKYTAERLNGHYPIFKPLSCELLRNVGAHNTWFCHLSRVWNKRNVNISILLQATKPLRSRWSEQGRSIRCAESIKWQGEQGYCEDPKKTMTLHYITEITQLSVISSLSLTLVGFLVDKSLMQITDSRICFRAYPLFHYGLC